MYEFSCGSPVCKMHLYAANKDELMGLVGQHVVGEHRVSAPTKSMVQFLEANTILEYPSTAKVT
jgi:predicted small metal-binding protein